MQIGYHAQSVLSDLSGNGSEGFRDLVWFLSLSIVHAHFQLYSCLHCSVLCLSSGATARMFVPEKYCPTSVWSPSPATSCFLPQHVNTKNPWLLPKILVSYYQHSLVGYTAIQVSVFEMYTLPLFWDSTKCLEFIAVK